MSCAGCKLDFLQGDKLITCTSNSCKQTFHGACTNAARLTKDEVDTWICPDCSAKARKGGDNSSTPVRNAAENITVRKKAPQQPPESIKADPAAAGPVDALNSLSSEINLLRKSASDMWDMFMARLDDISCKVTSFDNRIKSLEKLEEENIMLKSQVADLQCQLDNQAQAHLRNEVEILGLEELPEENPYHLVLTTAVVLGVKLDVSDLAHVSRVGPKHQPGNNYEKTKQRLQRPLVVAFVHRSKRDDFLKQAKARRSTKSSDIVGQGPHTIVYVNERLTASSRRLFRTTRVFAGEQGYKHCWVRHGSIYIRKQDARYGSPAIRIRSEGDLSRLSQPSTQCAPATGQLDSTE